ncbi:LAMI_0G05072g1_1 [Lachancea mirantina]|uniref:LAMI_0G05072g1_1 n=1 Tax=Lachancea mirantina TaxID=1230905 RepID=A0A1G4K8Q4_9SACH|nr:LAMI_0G05072g1_1 [Lachancea mirantina]
MCGRYALNYSGEELNQRLHQMNFEVQLSRDNISGHEPSFNVAPTQDAPVYTTGHELRYMKWGLVPQWTKDVSQAKLYKTFNARTESLGTSKMWKVPCQRKRCVVPVSGYYEWITKNKTKVPYYVTRKDRQVMFLAGLWDRVPHEDFYSFTIITSPAPPNMKWLHFRMPVIFTPGSKEWDAWMDDSKHEWADKTLIETLKARCYEDVVEWWQANSDVNKVSNNGSYLIEPVKKEEEELLKKPVEEREPLHKKQKSEIKADPNVPSGVNKKGELVIPEGGALGGGKDEYHEGSSAKRVKREGSFGGDDEHVTKKSKNEHTKGQATIHSALQRSPRKKQVK